MISTFLAFTSTTRFGSSRLVIFFAAYGVALDVDNAAGHQDADGHCFGVAAACFAVAGISRRRSTRRSFDCGIVTSNLAAGTKW